MSLSQRVADLATRTATENKSIRWLLNGNKPDLSSLTTTTKSDLVSAINEVVASVIVAGIKINDTTAQTTTVYSSSRVEARITSRLGDLIGTAPANLDTLQEIAAQMSSDETAAGAIMTNLTTLTTNVGNTDTDFVAIFNAALV